jgi:hypothetical protein
MGRARENVADILVDDVLPNVADSLAQVEPKPPMGGGRFLQDRRSVAICRRCVSTATGGLGISAALGRPTSVRRYPTTPTPPPRFVLPNAVAGVATSALRGASSGNSGSRRH